MHEYYFKIKKGDLEFECSTTDKFTFEEKLSDWINGVVYAQRVDSPAVQQENTQEAQSEEKPERSGFIDVKNLTTIKELQSPGFTQAFDSTQDIGELKEISSVDFEQTLEESINNPKTEVVEKTEETDSFGSYIQAYSPKSQLDYLIVTASYIMNKERAERFSVKQLNSKLIPLLGEGGKPVDHGDIQEAINQNLIRIVPDLTGMCEVTEYTLTEQGEGYFVE